MIEKGRFYLDANILIAMVEHDTSQSRRMRGLMAAVTAASEESLVTSELAIAEAMVGPARDHDPARLAIYNGMRAHSAIRCVPCTWGIFEQAIAIRAQNKPCKMPDAIHLSTAMCLFCEYIITADARWQSTYRIDVDDPSVLVLRGLWPLSIGVIGPDDPVLDSHIPARMR